MKNESLNRKDFFKKASLFGISAVGLSTLIKACGGGEETPATQTAAVDPCNEGLSDSDKQLRESLGYVAETPNPDQRCDNCQLWIPKEDGEPCGGCTILPGQPIHAGGWCNSWIAKS